MGMTSSALQSQLSLQLGDETTLGQDAAWATPSKELGDKAYPAALGATPAALTTLPFFEGGPHASWGPQHLGPIRSSHWGIWKGALVPSWWTFSAGRFS